MAARTFGAMRPLGRRALSVRVTSKNTMGKKNTGLWTRRLPQELVAMAADGEGADSWKASMSAAAEQAQGGTKNSLAEAQKEALERELAKRSNVSFAKPGLVRANVDPRTGKPRG